jgi:membrane-bound lytic murein transglycosylase B
MSAKLFVAAAAALACAFAAPAAAQSPGKAIVSIYHVAPGHQVAFLKWIDQQNRISAAAGISGSQLYAHTDGDSWDYVIISPVTTDAQDDAFDAAGKKMGINTMRGGMELRSHLTSHTDTFTNGPMTAAEYLAMIGEK